MLVEGKQGEEEEEEEEEGEEEGLVLTWRRHSCTQTGPHSRGLSGATLQSAPLKAPSHLHRPVFPSQAPWLLQSEGHVWASQASPDQPPSHLQLLLTQRPWALHSLGHAWMPQSDPFHPGLHTQYPFRQ